MFLPHVYMSVFLEKGMGWNKRQTINHCGFVCLLSFLCVFFE